ncbi:hypothetical protein [Virgibacillus profundi]|nr:hypothetical protein [Virgibacillus profundi]
MEKKKKKDKDHWLLDILLTIPELIFLALRGIVRGIINLVKFWN